MPTIEDIGQEISERQRDAEELSEKFEGLNKVEKGHNVKESFLSKPIDRKNPGKVAGIDGGLVKKRYSSSDIVAARAVAAVLDFGEESLNAGYIPSKNPDPEFFLFDQKDDRSMEKNAEAERLKKETEVAVKALKKSDTVLMDGSIVPSYLEDDEAIDRYRELFDKADSGTLVGVVEDSHGLKMANVLEEKLEVDIGEVRDTLLMDAVLESGERSFVRRYSDSPVEHPVLQRLDDETANKILTFYVKLSSKDLPLRIDYYGAVEDANTIAGKLISLKSSDSYTIPSPILEADKRAKIPEKYMKRLEKRFSPGLRRRDRRRF